MRWDPGTEPWLRNTSQGSSRGGRGWAKCEVKWRSRRKGLLKPRNNQPLPPTAAHSPLCQRCRKRGIRENGEGGSTSGKKLMQVCSGCATYSAAIQKSTRMIITLYHQAWSYVHLRLTAKTIPAVVQNLVKEVILVSLPFLCRSENLLSKSFHSSLDCCSARMCYIALWHLCIFYVGGGERGLFVFCFFVRIALEFEQKKKCRGFFQVRSRLLPGSFSSASLGGSRRGY